MGIEMLIRIAEALFICFIVSVAFMFLVVTASWIVFYIKRWLLRRKEARRRRETDRRIIAQAKAAGAWDKRPIVLGGRALELKAWEDFKIKREPGEPDAHLRRRCMTAADNELANTPREG